jgi:hypothetical protein
MTLAKKPQPTKKEVTIRKFIRRGDSKPARTAASNADLVPTIIRFPRELAEWLNDRAAGKALSRAAYIRMVLDKHREDLERMEKVQ